MGLIGTTEVVPFRTAKLPFQDGSWVGGAFFEVGEEGVYAGEVGVP